MKCCVIQPFYSTEYSRADELFEKEIRLLESCTSDTDIIVLPEASDVPVLARTRQEYVDCYTKYGPVLLEKCAETAVRCNSMVFVNATYVHPETHKERNTTYCFNRSGEVVGHYFKQHLTPGEFSGPRELDSTYSFEPSEPTVIEMEGIRFAFLTCYDFYFYEAFANIARQNVDIIIGCSHQRSDRLDAIELIDRFCCYNTNAYMVRASVTLDENSDIGGGSMIVAPDGKILANLGHKVGMASAEIDPKAKYLKPAGFGNPPAAHYQYIEKGRRGWKYRPGGSAIVPNDAYMSYPRLCAHRGFGQPENSLPALAAAVALGAQEIEFDLWPTKDGELVSLHDRTLDRVSDGHGFVGDYTLAELEKLDFGAGIYEGLKVLRFEDILKKLACHCVMNIHLKTPDTECSYDTALLRSIEELVFRYDCEKHIYFMSGNDTVIRQIRETLPWATACMGGGSDYEGIVDRAIAADAHKVQLIKDHFTQDMIDKAHAHNIKCNLFWSDTVEEAKRFFEMGVDTILTNNFLPLSQYFGLRT